MVQIQILPIVFIAIFTPVQNLIQVHTLHFVVMSLPSSFTWNISSAFVFHNLDIFEDSQLQLTLEQRVWTAQVYLHVDFFQ